jgi:hypothetical protein
MNQLKEQANDQFCYLGRWVSRKNFRAMVYSTDEKQKLVNSYEEFNNALESGEWFASKELAKPIIKATRKAKNGSDS